jgi:glycerol uptake facilitator-like aquaporin
MLGSNKSFLDIILIIIVGAFFATAATFPNFWKQVQDLYTNPFAPSVEQEAQAQSD